jgi:hypothetical protein
VTGANAALETVDARARRWASSLEIPTVLGGRYYLRGDSIVIQVWVTERGEVVASIGPVSASLIDPTLGIDTIRRRAMAVLAAHVDPALSQWARSASQPPSFEAYREFSEGRDAFNHDDFQGAVEHYLRASALDSAYIYPLIMAAQLKWVVLGAPASADSLVRAARRRGRLAPFDDALASMLEAQLADDYERTYDAAQRLRRFVVPGSDWELDAAAAAVALNRAKEALEIVRGVNLERASATDHWDVFVPVANAYHLAGENETLLAVLRQTAKRWPRAALVIVAKMEALAALSRPDEARAEWQILLGRREGEPASLAMWAAWQGARELRAHGSPAAARVLAQEALDSFPVLPTSSKFGQPSRWRMQALREAGRDGEALTVAESLSVRQPTDVVLMAIVGAIAARMGDIVKARRMDTIIASTTVENIDLRGRMLAQARLAAALGDRDRAVRLLRSACMHGCPSFEDLHSDLEFDGLRAYPPFVDVLSQRR